MPTERMEPRADTALRIERRGHVVILENQDPPRNRMTFEYMDELGRAHALDMILRAKKIDGSTTLAIGLVHELHPVAELKARAVEPAEELAVQPPLAVAGALRAIVAGEQLPLEEALRLERDAVRRCSSSADQVEGMMAFLEKRPPKFEGK